LDQVRLFVGKDPRETVGYHVFVESVLSRTDPNRISITALTGDQGDASTTFSKARFSIPELCGYRGWAIWADGSDMLCRSDIRELWDLRRSGYDIMVVPHDYKTKFSTKFLGQPNENYPKKNQSSLFLIDCGNAVWRRPEYKAMLNGPAGPLHRFEFLDDDRIGHLPVEWNWLVSEMPYNPNAKLVHMTIGIPPFYPSCDYSAEWFNEMRAMNHHEHWDSTALVSER
jgi:hypothetical protein